MKNKYIYRSRISEAKFRQVGKLFSMDLTAVQTAELTEIRQLSLSFSNPMGKYILKSSRLQKPHLKPDYQRHAEIESVIYSDGWRGYEGLVDFGYEKHFRVNHGDNEFSKGDDNHINGIEGFWGYAKNRLYKFKGIKKDKFYFCLKETEFRFNSRGQNLYHVLLNIFRVLPLNLS